MVESVSAVAASILNVSFYRFVNLPSPEVLRDRLKERALQAGLKGSILLSHEGINGFLAGPEPVLRPYLHWLFSEHPEFHGIEPKESLSTRVPFSRMLVKVKKEIITMGRPDIRPSEMTGRRIYPKQLKDWYDTKKEFVIVDTRNDYEVSQGTFKNAVHYDIETFKQFPEKLEKEAADLRDKTVVMFCTGGIRCEKATALAENLGIKEVFQLEGGILKYFEEVGGAHYRGDCFVFDHRTNVDSGLEGVRDRGLKKKIAGMKLYFHPDSPLSMRVVLALEAKGLPFEAVLVQPGTLPEEVRALNPHGEVPILQSQGLTLYQPNIILSYLDENFPETQSLTPVSVDRRARMRLWLDWVDSIFAVDIKKWMNERDTLGEEARHALEVKLEKDLYRLKTPLQHSRKFLVVDGLTQADLAAYGMLQTLRTTGFPKDHPERFALIWRWVENVEQAVKSKSLRQSRDSSTHT